MYFGNEWLIIYISFTLLGYEFTKMEMQTRLQSSFNKMKASAQFQRCLVQKKVSVYVYIHPLALALKYYEVRFCDKSATIV